MWYEITYPFPNYNSATVEVWEWMNNFTPYFIVDVQWNPYIKAIQDGGLSKEVACGVVICKEWCMEMGQILLL